MHMPAVAAVPKGSFAESLQQKATMGIFLLDLSTHTECDATIENGAEMLCACLVSHTDQRGSLIAECEYMKVADLKDTARSENLTDLRHSILPALFKTRRLNGKVFDAKTW